jgi:hypothetical protein
MTIGLMTVVLDIIIEICDINREYHCSVGAKNEAKTVYCSVYAVACGGESRDKTKEIGRIVFLIKHTNSHIIRVQLILNVRGVGDNVYPAY